MSGKPAPKTGGVYKLTLTANNGVNPNATQRFTLTVDQAPAYKSAATTTFHEGAVDTLHVSTFGDPTPGKITMTGTGWW